MLESIKTLVDMPTGDDPLVTVEDRQATRKRRLLMQEAQKRAKECMAEAQEQADSIRAKAFQDGYAQGVLQTAAELSQLLLQSRLLATTLQTDLLAAASELLGELLMDPQLLDELLQRWQARQPSASRRPLQIILPLRCKADWSRLKLMLNELGVVNPEVSFHPQERYLFRLDDQVVELDIGATQERLAPRLLARLEHLPDSVRQLDNESKALFVNWADRLGGSDVGDGEIEQVEATDEA